MFLLWRLFKLAVKLVLLLAVALVAIVLWGNFWPRSRHAPRVKCSPHHIGPCRAVSGRVLYHTAFGPHSRAHVVLMSRSSVTLPGITSVEFPRMRRAPAGLGFGDWISATGERGTGSHGENELHVSALATGKVTMRCADPSTHHPCNRLTAGT